MSAPAAGAPKKPADIASRKPPKGMIPEVGYVLEGTFPYVKGGVSSWIDQAVNAMPQVTFGIHFIGGDRSLYPHGQVYKLGTNILAYEEDFLRGEPLLPKRRATKAVRARFAIAVDTLIDSLNGPRELEAFWVVSDMVTDDHLHLTLDDLFATPEGWEVVRHTYNRFAQGESFLDFHYAFRNVAASLWEALLLSKKPLPPECTTRCARATPAWPPPPPPAARARNFSSPNTAST